jgi:CRP/FNR family transcriptional regulator, dissimilatory nitrate respiration regulator
MTIVSILKNAELFKDIGEENLKAIGQSGSTHILGKNVHIFWEGDEGTAFYVLLKGTLKLYKSSRDGQETIVKLVKPGEMFAEVVLFENNQYPVSAETVTESQVFKIERRDFLALLNSEQFRNEFITVLINKQRYLTQRILYLTAYDVEERFFRFLKTRYGMHISYTIDLTKKDIAAAIGTIPETLSRLLQRLKTRGVIQWEGDHLKLKDRFWDESSFEYADD